MRRKSRRSIACISIFLMMTLLSACSSLELEEREFPLAVGLDTRDGQKIVTLGFQNLEKSGDEKSKDTKKKEQNQGGESWEETFENSNAEYSKTMDYNHVKALIISKDILTDSQAVDDLMQFLEEKEIFARNTLLFTCEMSVEELMGAEQKLDTSMGNYLEQMMESNKKDQSQKLVTLGNLQNEYDNRTEKVAIPVITMEQEQPKIDHYYEYFAQND